MTNFPFFQHWVIQINFDRKINVNKLMVNDLAELIIKNLELNVVKETEYEFKNNGLTKIFILSQSHMVFHTWPEKKAIHIDLMTCSQNTDTRRLQDVFDDFSIREIGVTKLNY